ncbi:MAG: hypothetical protein ACRDOK_20495, partial [Streptosporangiaceae bacterium]
DPTVPPQNYLQPSGKFRIYTGSRKKSCFDTVDPAAFLAAIAQVTKNLAHPAPKKIINLPFLGPKPAPKKIINLPFLGPKPAPKPDHPATTAAKSLPAAPPPPGKPVYPPYPALKPSREATSLAMRHVNVSAPASPGVHDGDLAVGSHPYGWGGWNGPWLYEPTSLHEPSASCASWGEPIAMSPSMRTAARVQLRNSSGRPATVRASDGVLYLFAVENGEMTARPCGSGVLGDAPGSLYYLYRVNASGWQPITGEWMSKDQTVDAMTGIIESSPAADFDFGAYTWDGQTMRWTPMATSRATPS